MEWHNPKILASLTVDDSAAAGGAHTQAQTGVVCSGYISTLRICSLTSTHFTLAEKCNQVPAPVSAFEFVPFLPRCSNRLFLPFDNSLPQQNSGDYGPVGLGTLVARVILTHWCSVQICRFGLKIASWALRFFVSHLDASLVTISLSILWMLVMYFCSRASSKLATISNRIEY